MPTLSVALASLPGNADAALPKDSGGDRASNADNFLALLNSSGAAPSPPGSLRPDGPSPAAHRENTHPGRGQDRRRDQDKQDHEQQDASAASAGIPVRPAANDTPRNVSKNKPDASSQPHSVSRRDRSDNDGNAHDNASRADNAPRGGDRPWFPARNDAPRGNTQQKDVQESDDAQPQPALPVPVPPIAASQNVPASDADSAPPQPAAAATNIAAAPVITPAGDASGAQDTQQAGKQLREALQDQLGNIGQILLAMIQALSGGSAPAPVTSAPPVVPAGQASSNTIASAENVPAALPAASDTAALALQAQLQLQQAAAGNDAAVAIAAASAVPDAPASAPSLESATVFAAPASVVAQETPPAAAAAETLSAIEAMMAAMMPSAPAMDNATSAPAAPDAPVVTNSLPDAPPPATPIALLKDIQAILGQMQQALQTPAAPVQTSSNPVQAWLQNQQQTQDNGQVHLQALADTLQSDMAKLSQLLALQNDGAKAPPVASAVKLPQPAPQSGSGKIMPLTSLPVLSTDDGKAVAVSPAVTMPQPALQTGSEKLVQVTPSAAVPQPSPEIVKNTDMPLPALQASADAAAPLQPMTDMPQLSDLGALLKAGITQVRDQLQKLKNDNETVYALAKNAPPVPAADAAQAFRNALAGKGVSAELLPKDGAPQDAAPAPDRGHAQNTALPPVQTPFATPVVTTSLNMTAAAAALNVSQNGADTSGHNASGGNGQDQPPPQPVSSAGAGQPQTSVGATNSAFARALERAPQMPVLDQVTFQVKSALAGGSSRIHIQLDPADLGKLDIRLDVGADGKTGVTVTADNRTTLVLLQQDAQGLARALADAGLSTDSGSLNFNLRGGQQESGQGPGAQAAATYQKTQPDEEEDLPINAITRSYTVNLAEGLDIRI